MFKTFKKWSPDTWKQSLVQEIAEKFRVTNTLPEHTAGDTNNRIDDIDIQIYDYVKDLIKAVQEPLQTRWWTVGSAAYIVVKHSFVLNRMTPCVKRDSDTTQVVDRKIASRLLYLLREPAIMMNATPLMHCWKLLQPAS
jgi:hypothetical protein